MLVTSWHVKRTFYTYIFSIKISGLYIIHTKYTCILFPVVYKQKIKKCIRYTWKMYVISPCTSLEVRVFFSIFKEHSNISATFGSPLPETGMLGVVVSHWLERSSVTQQDTEMVKLADNILRLILLFPLHLSDVTIDRLSGLCDSWRPEYNYRFILEQFILTFRLNEFPGKSGRAMVIRGSAVSDQQQCVWCHSLELPPPWRRLCFPTGYLVTVHLFRFFFFFLTMQLY